MKTIPHSNPYTLCSSPIHSTSHGIVAKRASRSVEVAPRSDHRPTTDDPRNPVRNLGKSQTSAKISPAPRRSAKVAQASPTRSFDKVPVSISDTPDRDRISTLEPGFVGHVTTESRRPRSSVISGRFSKNLRSRDRNLGPRSSEISRRIY